MSHSHSTSSGPTADRPLYVVYGYMRDARRFADQRGLPRADVLSLIQGAERLRGQNRRIVLVDTDHPMPFSSARLWLDVRYIADMVNGAHGHGETERIYTTRDPRGGTL